MTSQNKAFDNRYRPAYERSALFVLPVAMLYFWWYFKSAQLLQFTENKIILAMIFGVLFFLWIKYWNGYRTIKRYRRNLTRLEPYSVRSDDIPWSKKALFLGKGFKWDQRHTQRLFQTRQPEYLHLTTPSKWYERARKLEIENPEHWLTKYTLSNNQWNPVRPLPPVGGNPALHGVETEEQDVWLTNDDRAGHVLVLGTTGVGKTRLAEILVTQDIHRGDIVIVFDPKGDLELLKRMYSEAKKAGRDNHFYMFHLGFPELSARYNPIGSFGKITEVATRIANQLPGEGQSAAFKEFVWRFVNIISRTMNELGEKPSYERLYSYASNIDDLCLRYFEHYLTENRPDWKVSFESEREAILKAGASQKAGKTQRSSNTIALSDFIGIWHNSTGRTDPLIDALRTMLTNDRSYFEKLVSSLYPLLEKLTTGSVAALLSPDYTDTSEKRPLFDWNMVLNQGGIVYVGLDSLSDAEVAAAVGNAMLADLTSIAGYTYKHGQHGGQIGNVKGNPLRKVALHVDEFNELIGDEFIPMLNKARGAGFNVTSYTQTVDDIEAKIGSASKAAQIVGNFNTIIMLRVRNLTTAQLLTDQLGEVNVISTTTVSSVTDTNDPTAFADFSSKNEDRVASTSVVMLEPSDLMELPKGQAFAMMRGGQLFKLRMPLPEEDNDEWLNAGLDAVAAALYQRFERTEHQSNLTVEGVGSGWKE